MRSVANLAQALYGGGGSRSCAGDLVRWWPRPARSSRTPYRGGQHRPGQRAQAGVRPDGIDVWEVIDAAKTKPFGFQAFYPGPGLGGHCIPIDPFYRPGSLHRSARTRFIELAGEINTAMPHYVVDRVTDAFERPRQGGAVAAGSSCSGPPTSRMWTTAARSPAIELMELLQDRGATVAYSDPHVPTPP